MDIDEMADTMRDKVFAIVGSAPDNDPGKPSRKVKIERIIYLPGAVSGSTINITFSIMLQGLQQECMFYYFVVMARHSFVEMEHLY
jgi:uncharacterized membrane protein